MNPKSLNRRSKELLCSLLKNWWDWRTPDRVGVGKSEIEIEILYFQLQSVPKPYVMAKQKQNGVVPWLIMLIMTETKKKMFLTKNIWQKVKKKNFLLSLHFVTH